MKKIKQTESAINTLIKANENLNGRESLSTAEIKSLSKTLRGSVHKMFLSQGVAESCLRECYMQTAQKYKRINLQEGSHDLIPTSLSYLVYIYKYIHGGENMKFTNIRELQKDASGLVSLVEKGEDVIITKTWQACCRNISAD